MGFMGVIGGGICKYPPLSIHTSYPRRANASTTVIPNHRPKGAIKHSWASGYSTIPFISDPPGQNRARRPQGRYVDDRPLCRAPAAAWRCRRVGPRSACGRCWHPRPTAGACRQGFCARFRDLPTQGAASGERRRAGANRPGLNAGRFKFVSRLGSIPKCDYHHRAVFARHGNYLLRLPTPPSPTADAPPE